MHISLKSLTLILFILCVKSHIAKFSFNFFYYPVESDATSTSILHFNVKFALILIFHLNFPGFFSPMILSRASETDNTFSDNSQVNIGHRF